MLDQKIGDMYASCMDTASIEKKGLAPIQSELARIGEIGSEPEVGAEVVRLQRMGVPVLFSFGGQPDAKDSNRTIATLAQGGLSLPDRDYYLKTDPKSEETHAHFVAHMKKMFQLAGDSADTAAAKAAAVLDFETILAKASLDRVSLRDPDKRYHIMTRAQLKALSPWDWDGLFQGLGAPPFDTLNVAQPDFIKQIAINLPQNSAEPWKAYFEYHLLRASADLLPQAFEDEDFDFWQRFLTGAQQPRPRTARCVVAVDRTLGDLLGQNSIQADFRGGCQDADQPTGRRPDEGTGEGHPDAAVDERRHQEGRPGKAQSHHSQCGRAGQVARLQQDFHRPRRLHGQRACAPPSSSSISACSASASPPTRANGP